MAKSSGREGHRARRRPRPVDPGKVAVGRRRRSMPRSQLRAMGRCRPRNIRLFFISSVVGGSGTEKRIGSGVAESRQWQTEPSGLKSRPLPSTPPPPPPQRELPCVDTWLSGVSALDRWVSVSFPGRGIVVLGHGSCLQREHGRFAGNPFQLSRFPPVAQASPAFGRDSPDLAGRAVHLWVCMIILPRPIVSKH